MVVFPNCKINLGLHILDKRNDGFHNLATIFYPVPVKDSLEIIRAKEDKQHQEISFTMSGNSIEGATENNTCTKAYHLLKKDFPQLPAIQMHLHKAIPSGAGLGGGSADGSFTIKLLNEKFKLGLSTEQLINYSLELGSDCPFFIINQACFATGRGEILEPIEIPLSGYRLVLINPGIHINTGWAFSHLKIERPFHSSSVDLKDVIHQPVQTWQNRLINDFEIPVFKVYPQLQKIKESLYEQGASYAAMSGSGSTVYGLFDKATTPQINTPAICSVKSVIL